MDHSGALDGRSVLVTGASGFLGSHVVRGLDAASAKVHALVRPGRVPRRLHDLLPRLTVWPGDVTDYESVLRCCRGARPTAVVHLAGDTSGRKFDGDWSLVSSSVAVNLHGTLNVIRAAAESGAPVRTFVRAGGLEEYGTGRTPYDEAQRERPRSPYSAGQVSATHFGEMLQPYVDFAIVTLRPALVYGPAQSTDFFIPRVILSCLRNALFEMTAGQQCRDLLYVDDLVRAFLLVLERPGLRGAVINIASGEEVSIRSVAEEVVRLTGARDILRIGAATERAGDLEHLVAGTAHAATVLGWRRSVELTAGLERTIAWYAAHREEDVS
jgi:UDP-glucose 4-epimerase